MIPRYRAWISEADTMTNDLKGIDFENETVVLKKFYWEDGFPVEEEVFEVEIGNAIIMQSTGLGDKNGKEIFEGDVVSRNSGMPSVVKFGKWIYEEDFGYKIKNIGFHLNSSYDDDEWFQAMDYEDIRKNYEVIGNIYENLELLEDK